MRRIFSIAAVIALLTIGLGPVTVFAAAGNDDFAAAQVVSTFPFSAQPDLTDATTQTDEPQACYYTPNTVWYKFTAPADGTMTATTSRYDINLVVYTSSTPDITGLTAFRCGLGQTLQWPVTSGTTFYLQMGSAYSAGGPADITIDFIPPPANDAFEAATVITSLPFTDVTSMVGTSLQFDEPLPPCLFGPRYGSIWYKFTPTVTASVTASVATYAFTPDVTIRQGSSLGSLVNLACQVYPPTATIKAQAGVTYYIQVTASNGVGPMTFSLDLASPPAASFSTTVGDPSAFDTIGFVDQSSDPGNAGIASQAWTFGDGATGSGYYVQHRYAADGDYEVTLTITTTDGRTATLTRTISVRTHDVAIAKLIAPNAASSGQTRSITVGIVNQRYPETVTVTLTKATPFGNTTIGTLTQAVPVRSANRTTDFTFSYTFTADDARVGKVSFLATATLQSWRDAIPGDNQAQSLPTKVGK